MKKIMMVFSILCVVSIITAGSQTYFDSNSSCGIVSDVLRSERFSEGQMSNQKEPSVHDFKNENLIDVFLKQAVPIQREINANEEQLKVVLNEYLIKGAFVLKRGVSSMLYNYGPKSLTDAKNLSKAIANLQVTLEKELKAASPKKQSKLREAYAQGVDAANKEYCIMIPFEVIQLMSIKVKTIETESTERERSRMMLEPSVVNFQNQELLKEFLRVVTPLHKVMQAHKAKLNALQIEYAQQGAFVLKKGVESDGFMYNLGPKNAEAQKKFTEACNALFKERSDKLSIKSANKALIEQWYEQQLSALQNEYYLIIPGEVMELVCLLAGSFLMHKKVVKK